MIKTEKKQVMKKAFRTKWKYVLAMVPSLILFTLISIYPNISVFPLSMYDWSPIRSSKVFVGLQNFKMLFLVNKENTLELIGNTVLYVLGLFVIQTVLSLVLALALQKNTKRNKFFRAYFFLPMVFSTAMIGLTWQFMYDPNLGIINNILGSLGVEGFPGKYFFGDNFSAIILIVVVHIWANLGYPITIILSGLNTISSDLNEAAMVDGANGWQRFSKITFPLLVPTLTRLSLLTFTTGALTADYIVMVGGHSDTLSSYIYEQTRQSTAYGMVSALGVLLFFILAIASLIQFLGMRKVEKTIFG